MLTDFFITVIIKGLFEERQNLDQNTLLKRFIDELRKCLDKIGLKCDRLPDLLITL